MKVRKALFEILFIVTDFICFALVYAFVLMGMNLNSDAIKTLAVFFVSSLFVRILVNIILSSYRMITSNYSFRDAIRTIIISLIISLTSYLTMYLIPSTSLYHLPLALCFLLIVVETTISVGVRCIKRIYRTFSHRSKKDGKRTIIIGAGAGGKMVLDEIEDNIALHNKVVAFVDDDALKIKKVFSKYLIEGPISDIDAIIKKYKAEEVIIAIADLDEKRLFEIVQYMKDSNVRIRRLPLFKELDKNSPRKVIDVNINELLSRSPIELANGDIHDFIHGKTVLVTGAGGSIGSELVKQIFAQHPKVLVLFDIYENGVYDVQQTLVRKMRRDNITDIQLFTLIGSTYNEVRMEQIFKKYRPDLVFHAAAYKHVPLMEDSPVEAIRTNVIGTYNVARLADKYGVKKMVLVSTDKAVRPTNVMGATKRFAEMIIQYFAEKSSHTAYSAVRFGNVLGSNGSVIPLFQKQIAEGGPVTVTSREMTRFFMTIPEAVSLILQSGVYAKGGEIFILDMGKPVKIIDLAEKMVRQAGYTPYVDMDIIEIGLRPGEKMYEEILLEVSKHTKTDNNKIFVEEREPVKPIEDEIVEISKVFSMEDNEDIKHLLAKIITTYKEPQKI